MPFRFDPPGVVTTTSTRPRSCAGAVTVIDPSAAIIDGVQGPLVDGRPYKTDAFLEQAEDYHRLAVEAHKGHGKVDAKLPVFGNGQVAASTYPQPDP